MSKNGGNDGVAEVVDNTRSFDVLILIGKYCFDIFCISQYDATDVYQSTAKFRLIAELSTAQPQLIFTFVTTSRSLLQDVPQFSSGSQIMVFGSTGNLSEF